MNDKNKEIKKDVELEFSNNNSFIIPELSNLGRLHSLIKNREQAIFSNIDVLQSSLQKSAISSLLTSFKIKELEKLSADFINDELDKSGLMKEISTANNQAVSILQEIKFFSTDSSYLTGFLSSDFSQEDKEKWIKIENILSNVYNSESGSFRKAQDYFVFKVSREELAKVFGRTEITFEEELFIRSILIKGYLVNLRQLILPFYSIDDNILIGFKKERIAQLETQKLLKEKNPDIEKELTLLQNQICSLEDQKNLIREKDDDLNRKLKFQNITVNNTKLNSASVTIGTVETARYFTSFIGHKTNSEILKNVGNFGLKGSSFFAKCIPFVSAITEAGTQMNNNYVIYNYEKRLKISSIVDDLKSNLITLEQQVTDYYINNVLSRLQEKLFEEQKLAFSLVEKTQADFLISRKDQRSVDLQITEISDQYRTNVLEVQERVSSAYQKQIDWQDKLLSEKTAEVFAKENHLQQLKNQISNFKKEHSALEKKLLIKSVEFDNLTQRIAIMKDDLQLTNILLENERKSMLEKEKSLKELMSGNLKGNFILQLERANKAREQAEITVSILLRKQNELEEDIERLSNDSRENQQTLADEKETLTALNEHLNQKLNNLKNQIKEVKSKAEQESDKSISKLFTINLDKQKLIAKNQALSEKNSELENKINQYLNNQEQYDNLLVSEHQTLLNLKVTRDKLAASNLLHDKKDKELRKVYKRLIESEKQREEIMQELSVERVSYFGIVKKNIIVQIVVSLIAAILLIKIIWRIIEQLISKNVKDIKKC